MSRKRGGLAGLWDRNKQFIKPIATIGAGLINPALGAAVGGAMGGLDRPGQGGIGLDVGRGALGAAQGYAMGKGAQALKGLFAPSAAPAISGSMPAVGITPGGAGPLTQSMAQQASSAAVPKISGAMPAIGITPGGAGSLTQSMGAVTPPPPSSPPPSSSRLGDLFSPQVIGGVAQGTLGALQQERTLRQGQRQFERTTGLAEARFGEEQRLNALNEERRRRMAQLMAMFAPGVLRGLGVGQAPMAEG